MKSVIDFHIHSRYSRACSPRLTLANIALAAERKGVDIVATGDFTHPAWFKSINSELEEIGDSGRYRLRKSTSRTKFILSTEVSLVYRENDRARRIHLVVQAPSLQAVAALNKILGAKYNIHSDGRPILGIAAPAFIRLCLDIDTFFIIYPAHIWTPWYSVFGSNSGFDSLAECFQQETDNIFAYETGLSSDPPMNWRLSALDNVCRLSNSDAHSLDSIGREANVFAFHQENYQSIYNIIKNNLKAADQNGEGIIKTIEFYPEEGTYHLDGHRHCSFSCLPEKSVGLKNVCPRCGRALTIGVLNRVNVLAGRPVGFQLAGAVPFVSVVGLDKIIAGVIGVKNRQAVKVRKIYDRIIEEVGNELFVLTEADIDRLQVIHPETAAAIARLREGKVKIEAGFDGQYGRIELL